MSKLTDVVVDLPKDADEAVAVLMGFDFSSDDRVDGYYEKESELINPNSLDELASLFFCKKLPKEVYYKFLDARKGEVG